MFQNSGLSLEQAPPIEVVLRLFLTGSIFGVVFSIMLLFWHNDLENIYAPTTLTIVHIFTIGIMASFMLGALFQMLPVLCGVHIKAPSELSFRITIFLIVGLIFLISGFLNQNSSLYIFASIFLGFSLLATSFYMIKELYKIKHSNSSRGMLVSLISLFVLTTAAIGMLLIRSGIDIGVEYEKLKSLHVGFALFGWIAVLIISVSFQVVEMFYVTKKYSDKYAKYLIYSIIVLLSFYSVLRIINFGYQDIFLYILVVLISIHAISTLIRLKNKKRAISDASVYFWYLGMFSAILFSLSFLFGLDIRVKSIFFIYFSLSIVFAMSYKIVPFLVWFHLNAKGYFDAPMMHEVVSPKYAKINFYIYLLSFFSFLSSYIISLIFYIATFLLLISFFMLLLSIYNGLEKYKYVLENGKKFNFNLD